MSSSSTESSQDTHDLLEALSSQCVYDSLDKQFDIAKLKDLLQASLQRLSDLETLKTAMMNNWDSLDPKYRDWALQYFEAKTSEIALRLPEIHREVSFEGDTPMQRNIKAYVLFPEELSKEAPRTFQLTGEWIQGIESKLGLSPKSPIQTPTTARRVGRRRSQTCE